MGALRPKEPAAQRVVGESIEWLVNTGKDVDVVSAALLLPALGDKHRMGRRIADAFEAAVGRGQKIPGKVGDEFVRAGIPIKRKGLPDKLRTRLFGRRRRW
jgi:outer membrane PBP1 activator LpoA protein